MWHCTHPGWSWRTIQGYASAREAARKSTRKNENAVARAIRAPTRWPDIILAGEESREAGAIRQRVEELRSSWFS